MILIKNSKRALYCRYYAVVQVIFTPTIEPAMEWVKVRTAENLKRKIYETNYLYNVQNDHVRFLLDK